MRSLFLVIMLLVSSNAFAALHKETINYKQGEAELEGYLVYDDAMTGKRPGVLVVHEWKGLNDYAKSRADQLAELGYVAFAADIYGKGVRPTTTEEAGATSGKYKGNRMLLRSRILAARDVLQNNVMVEPDKIAAIGYCFGGTTVLELARSGADVKGVVSFHGGLSAGDASNGDIKAKILVLHGDADPFVPPAEVDAFKKEMDTAGADYEFVGYPGAVHGFTNPDNTGEIPGALYDANADSQSWQEMQTFLNKIF